MAENVNGQNCRKFALTFGKRRWQPAGSWTDRRELTLGEFHTVLTTHTTGEKDGPCIVPALLRQPERKAEYADEIGVLFLDSDCGHTIEEIEAKIRKHGYGAIIYSTHSHLSTTTTVNRDAFEKLGLSGEDYLLQIKKYLPRVANDAKVSSDNTEDTVLVHQPCPKYRIVMPLDKTWRAKDHKSQEEAIQVWKERYLAVAEHLGLNVDSACSDPSRLFYLPRHSHGAVFETRIIEGADLPIWNLPSAPKKNLSTAGPVGSPNKSGHSVDQDVIGAFNRAHNVDELLERYGYTRKGRRYLSPTSSTKEPGVSVRDGRAFSHHGSDLLFTGGAKGDHGHDAFSIFRIWEHDGDLKKAVKAAAQLLNINMKPNLIKREASSQSFPHTDFGNAERFASQHRENVRYCHTWGKWLVWSGKHWEIDETGKIYQFAKATIRSIYAEAAHIEDDDRRKTVAKHARASESSGRIQSMISLAQSEPGIAVRADDLDNDPWLLNVLNGTLDLKTGQLRPHGRDHLITKLALIHYNPAAHHPEWDTFLNRIMAGSTGLIAYLQKLIGYSLTGDTREKCLPVLHGTGNNGKTIFTATVGGMLGDYAQETPVETLMIKRNEGIPNDIARLKGARLVTASEGERGQRLAESLIKRLTGGDKIAARFMRAEFFEFIPEFKILFSTNHKPTIRGTDSAIWSRIHLIPFDVTIPKAEQIPRTIMLERLKHEWPGILRWAVEGCLLWQKDGLQKPEEVERATAEYRADSDIIGGFISDCCIVNPLAKCSKAELRDAYVNWCLENKEEALTTRNFKAILLERGIKDCKVGEKSEKGWKGIGFKKTGSQDQTGPNFTVFPIEKNHEKNKVKNRSETVPPDPYVICSDCADFQQNPADPNFQGHCLGNPPDGERPKFPKLEIDCPEFRAREVSAVCSN